MKQAFLVEGFDGETKGVMDDVWKLEASIYNVLCSASSFRKRWSSTESVPALVH